MDKLLEEMFKPERWEKAIQIAIDKDMPHNELERFCSPNFLGKLYKLIRDNEYSIIPPHQQAIPKDDGGVRIVYINEDVDYSGDFDNEHGYLIELADKKRRQISAASHKIKKIVPAEVLKNRK